MSLHVTEEDINAFGRYDKLVEQVNIDVAKEYFEKAEKTEIPKRKVRSKLDKLLREFILSGGFEISTNDSFLAPVFLLTLMKGDKGVDVAEIVSDFLLL